MSTNAPENFEVLDDLAVFRPAGEMPLDRAIQVVTEGITHARRRGLRKLLINVTGLVGFPPPSLAERYFFVNEWARAAGGVLRMAMVARPEMIDPEKFGVTVAANAGLVADVFTSEEEALAWLRRPGG